MEQTNQLPAAKVSVTEREPESLPDSSSLQNVETGTSKHVETQEEDVSPILRETPSKSREDNDRQETEQPRYDIDSHVYISQEATDGQNLDPMEKTLKKETDRDNQPGENEEGAIYHISATKKEIFSTSNNFFNVFANPAEGNSKTSLPAATGVMNGSYRKKNAQDKEDEWLKRMCETQEANESKVSN